MNEKRASHIGYIDIAKCVAIVSVVLGHVLAYDLYGFDTAWTKSSLMQFIYSFHMPLFIFLSGLLSVIVIPKGQLQRDIVKRIRTLLIPFVLIASIYSIWFNGDFSFITNDYKFGYWYLFVLCAFYFATYPICLYRGGKNV